MVVEYFTILCDYNYWAHHQVWDCVLALTDEQFAAEAIPTSRSVHQQVVHMVGAEWLWLSRLQGASPTHLWTTENLPTRDDVRIKWDEVEADVRAYIDTLRDTQLSRIMMYTTTTGEPQRNARWEILAHMFNHSTDHRAQLMATIATLGGPTVEQDLLHYFRGNKHHRRQIAMARFHKQGID